MTTHPNGTQGKRVRARVESASVRKRTHTVSDPDEAAFDRSKAESAGGRVGSVEGCDRSKPDTRGVVPGEEQERLSAGFGGEVRRLRTDAGLTQARASDLAGLSPDHVGRLERGQRRPTVQAIKALARILAPTGEREAVEQRLARLAGMSLREGAERKKQLKTNKGRREAVADLERLVRRTNATIARQEAAGWVVSGTLRSLAERMTENLQRIRATVAEEQDPEGITGHAAVDSIGSRPPRKGRKEILQWYVDRANMLDQKQDDEDSEWD